MVLSLSKNACGLLTCTLLPLRSDIWGGGGGGEGEREKGGWGGVIHSPELLWWQPELVRMIRTVLSLSTECMWPLCTLYAYVPIFGEGVVGVRERERGGGGNVV